MVPQPEYMTSTSLCCHAERSPLTVMLNEVKHLYNKDSSLALRMTTKFSE